MAHAVTFIAPNELLNRLLALLHSIRWTSTDLWLGDYIVLEDRTHSRVRYTYSTPYH